MSHKSSGKKVSTYSPCVNICTIDAVTGFCHGCFRTVEEISGWLTFSDREKLRVLDETEIRRKQNGF